MPRKRASQEQIIYALRQVEAGARIGDVCRQLGVAEQTYFRWEKQYAGLGVSELRRLKQLEEENVALTFDLGGMKDERPRVLDAFLREYAHQRGRSPGDAAARRKHLYREGIPYFTLFSNGYNHPNAFGHGLFVDEAMKCFA